MQLRSILNLPIAYKLFIFIIGGDRLRKLHAQRFIRARKGDRVLDIGCGTGNIVGHLPEVDYTGFDANPAYIEDAERQWQGRGKFVCNTVNEYTLAEKDFDLVLATGVIHHIDDNEATKLFEVAYDKLRPGGRLAILGCYREESVQDYLPSFG